MIQTKTKTRVILVADDDGDTRRLIMRAVHHSGAEHDVRFVTDGQELFDYLARRGGFCDPDVSPCPNLIILDLNMPRITGYECLRDIKATPGLNTIPVVVLTALASQREVDHCFALGANAFIEKPERFRDLVDRMSALCHFWFNVSEVPSTVA